MYASFMYLGRGRCCCFSVVLLSTEHRPQKGHRPHQHFRKKGIRTRVCIDCRQTGLDYAWYGAIQGRGAKEKTRIFKVIEVALEVYDHKKQKIPTSKLNDILLKAVEAYHAPVVRGHAVKIKYVTQLPTHVPSFAFFCNYPDDIKTPYRNYLENQIRSNFKFSGVPVRIFFRKK